jgi:hypothetical protein
LIEQAMNHTSLRRLWVATVLALAGISVAACQDHYSTQDAYSVCEDLTNQNPATNPPERFLDCVGCYESCGVDCKQRGTAPEDYVCPNELDEGAEGGAGGGTGGAAE